MTGIEVLTLKLRDRHSVILKDKTTKGVEIFTQDGEIIICLDDIAYKLEVV